jgi:hypothetical protein
VEATKTKEKRKAKEVLAEEALTVGKTWGEIK